jgi:hypothetical protein
VDDIFAHALKKQTGVSLKCVQTSAEGIDEHCSPTADFLALEAAGVCMP